MFGLSAQHWPWLVFFALVAMLLTLDLAFVQRRPSARTLRGAAGWAAFFVGVGLAFSLFVWAVRGPGPAVEYVTAFLIEESLSVDNLFVFLALFTYFSVPRRYQHRVLFWGIVGAIVMRGVFIFAGVALLERFHWLIYVLGALLIATGAKLGLGDETEVHPERNPIVKLASRLLPMTREYHGEHFVVREHGRLRFTPLVLVLIAVETTDVMFAVDSVPAVLAVSRDVFVVYTSNIFAVMGLRALYSVMAGLLGALRFLRPALALILVLVGAKMLLAEVYAVPVAVSLLVVALILAVAAVASVLRPGPARDG
ncbi:MAG: Integral rane protein TerC [Acidobacteria bacterium]|nr:Integral rane protein TerC [Acidobacteriota bacterium]